MTAHQMVCHLSDARRADLAERGVPVIGTLWERTVIRWLAKGNDNESAAMPPKVNRRRDFN
jgi:hypothetical protein